jgi:diguanylate cyclase (GGDEF)-like protein
MIEHVSVLLVGLDEVEQGLAQEDGFTVRSVATLDDLRASDAPDAIVIGLDGTGPLEAIRAARSKAPGAALVVITDPEHDSDGTVALHAGAEDHLSRDALLPALLPRAIRYSVAIRRVRSDLATTDEVTSLPNLRGFAPIAEHHLRMADRASQPVVFVFVRLDDHDDLLDSAGSEAAANLAKDAAAVVLEAVRDADVPARISPDTLCVLLTGEADGAETLVLSRLVEAMAVRDAAREDPRSLSLSVGTARYEPGKSGGLAEILEGALRKLTAGSHR